VDTINAIEEVGEVGRRKKEKKRTYPINCGPRATAILSLK
jgi:hypothetical protein